MGHNFTSCNLVSGTRFNVKVNVFNKNQKVCGSKIK